MLDTNIHNHLDKKEIRNIISDGLLAIYLLNPKRADLSKFPTEATADERILWEIETLEVEKENIDAKIEANRKRYGFIKLMQEFGWDEWDVSDHVRRKDSMWRNFIGTEDEYNELMKKLQKDLDN